MFLHQARAQQRRWWGGRCDEVPHMEADLESLLPPGYLCLSLVGARGAGKSSVGRALADRLSVEFLDLDHEIARKAGRPAGVVLEDEGEVAFRQLELETLEEVVDRLRHPAVLATGGGTILEGRDLLASRGLVAWLRAPAAELVRRIAGDDVRRPSLTREPDPLAEMHSVLEARGRLYEDCADVTLDTEGRDVSEVVEALQLEIGAHRPGARRT